MKPHTDLSARVAVIIGAARGVGLALALQAADRGMKVALADGDEYVLAAAAEQVRAKGVETIAVQGDMRDFATVGELARRTAAELGPPWLVCNNPGVSIEVNLWGVINGVQAFAPDMANRGGGHIVNIVAAELFGIRGAAPYVAATQAIVGLSEELYRELDLRRSRVGVTLVCPALVKTNITDAPDYQKATPSVMGDVPLNALPPEEIAEAIFAAMAVRRFRVSPTRELQARSGPCLSSLAMSFSPANRQLQDSANGQVGARYAEHSHAAGLAKRVTRS
jgi:short-subunit dehydrogenase